MEFGAMQSCPLMLYIILQGTIVICNWQKNFERPWFNEMLLSNKDLLGHYSFHSTRKSPCVMGLLEKYKTFKKSTGFKNV